MIYLGIIYFTDAVSEWRTILGRVLPICSCICSSSIDCYSFLHKYARNTIDTETWLQHRCIEFDLTICIISSVILIIIHLIPLSCPEFLIISFFPANLWSSGTLVSLFICNYNNWSLSIIGCCFSSDMYISLGFPVGCADSFGSSRVHLKVAF